MSEDHTAAVLHFLEESHGKVRLDARGDYAYEAVSAVSLHFLLQSGLPPKDVLWQWYAYWEQEQGESIYQTIRPQDDEVLLEILQRCDFAWDVQAVRDSGLIFLRRHREEIYMALEDIILERIEAYETLSDEELAAVLRPRNTWSDDHLRKIIHRIQTEAISAGQRASIYDELDSDYLRATARYQVEELTRDRFWKNPPPEMEGVEERLIIFARTMANAARRLGVYISRRDFEAEQAGARSQWTRGARFNGKRRKAGASAGGNGGDAAASKAAAAAEACFEVLELPTTASLLDVKNAYRRKVKEHHPDQGGTVQDFLRLQEAYEVLLTEVF